MKKSIVIAMTLALAMLPDVAEARSGKMHHAAPSSVEPTGAARAEQYAKALKWCRAHTSDPVDAEWGGHYGKKGWWCVPRRS